MKEKAREKQTQAKRGEIFRALVDALSKIIKCKCRTRGSPPVFSVIIVKGIVDAMKNLILL